MSQGNDAVAYQIHTLVLHSVHMCSRVRADTPLHCSCMCVRLCVHVRTSMPLSVRVACAYTYVSVACAHVCVCVRTCVCVDIVLYAPTCHFFEDCEYTQPCFS